MLPLYLATSSFSVKNVHPLECKSSSLLLFRLFFHPLKRSVLPGPCLRSYSLPILLPCLTSSSSDSMLASSTCIYLARHLLDLRCMYPCGFLTRIANLCVPRTDLSQIFPLRIPPALASQPGKSHGQRSKWATSPWDCKELDTTE